MSRMSKFAFVMAVLAAAPAGSQTSSDIDAYYPDLQTLYQDIHRNPELAFQEVQTAAKLAARLKALGYEVVRLSYRQVAEEPTRVAELLAALLS